MQWIAHLARKRLMIDTLKCETEPLDAATIDAIRARSDRRLKVNSEGLLMWELTTGELAGSFDHRLSVRLRDLRKGGTVLAFEGSVHKHLMGHNCYGGPVDARACGRYMIGLLQEHFGVGLPAADDWQVHRVDVAECYDLGSIEAVLEKLDGERQAVINLTTKRKVDTYETGWATRRGKGGETRLKAYAKGPDFLAHDSKRIWKSYTDPRMAEVFVPEVQKRANNLLRYEVEFYRPILRKLTESGRLGDIDSIKLHRIAEKLLSRFMRENEKEMTRVRTSRAVEKRLIDSYGHRLGSLLYGTWFRLAANGEEAVRANMKRRTYYWQRKQLLDAGCQWTNTDVSVFELRSAIPDGFFIGAASPWRVSGEHHTVRTALEPFLAAA